MLKLDHRVDMEELIDRPDIPLADLERSLTDIEAANRWMCGRKVLLRHVFPVLSEQSSVVDIGCGSGNMLRTISDESKRREESLNLTGIDVNPAILAIAQIRCSNYPNISFTGASATLLPFTDGSFDVVLSSLILHHFKPEDAVKVLSEAARIARRRVIMVDLIRSFIAFTGAYVVGKLAFGKLSRYDAPVSVKKAYTPDEMANIARAAGLQNVKIYASSVIMILVYDK